MVTGMAGFAKLKDANCRPKRLIGLFLGANGP